MNRLGAGLLSLFFIAGTFSLPAVADTVQGCSPSAAGYSCLYGPFIVPGGGSLERTAAVPAPPEPGYITRARATVVDPDGVPVPRHAVHLHHAVWTDPSTSDMTWPGLIAGNRFFASGKERTPLALPDGYGYYWSNEPPEAYPALGPIWGFTVHLDGMHKGHDMEVFVRLNLRFVPGEQGTLSDVSTAWFDVENGRTDPVYDVRKGSGGGIHKKVWRYTMPVGGRFIAAGGHLHDGGIKLVLRNVTKGERIVVSRAVYRKRDRARLDLRKMTSWTGLPGIRVGEGDVVRLAAFYDSSRARKNVMGIMMAALTTGSGGSVPDFYPED